MIERSHRRTVERQLDTAAAVVLTGPRQVGKTTLARDIAERRGALYLDLEKPSDAAKLGDVEGFCAANADRLLILDEVQRVPELFAPLRSIIDERRRNGKRTGQFLLLGSASIELLKQSSETLAGRVSQAELRPFDVTEIAPDQLNGLWVRGGFPESFLSHDDAISFDWRLDFIRTYLERDIPQLGPRIPAETLHRFWTMLAHNQGQPFNAAALGTSLAVSGVTASRYLDLMVDLLLVRRLSPWMANTGKRLIKSPKTYIRDSGLCHTLLGLQNLNGILGHPVAGASWEGLIIETLIGNAPRYSQYGFYRTARGAEIDLILQIGTEIWAIEVKRSTAPVVSRGFHSACEDLKPNRKFVVYPGSDRYPLKHGVETIGLAELVAELGSTT